MTDVELNEKIKEVKQDLRNAIDEQGASGIFVDGDKEIPAFQVFINGRIRYYDPENYELLFKCDRGESKIRINEHISVSLTEHKTFYERIGDFLGGDEFFAKKTYLIGTFTWFAFQFLLFYLNPGWITGLGSACCLYLAYSVIRTHRNAKQILLIEEALDNLNEG